MRYFRKPSGIDRLSLEARIVYTAFSVFMLLGYASSAWLYSSDGLGTSGDDAVKYYLGDDPSAGTIADPGRGLEPGPSPPQGPGPALEMPDDGGTDGQHGAELRFAKPPRQVMETFHFHLMTVPVCLLIISHLFMMSALPAAFKAWVIGIGSLATLVHIALPPIVRFWTPGLAPLVFPSAVVMAAAWLIMTLQPLIEMWRRPLGSRSDGDEGAHV